MTFKKGQCVKVLLDETHNLVDDPIEHDAVFIAEHGDGKWADVELDKEHAGKTRRLSVPLSVIKAAACLFFALLSFFSPAARAQFVGYVGLQTVSSQLANNVTCTGTTQTFTPPNLGQISHQASATSTAGSFTLEIDGTDSTGTVYRISNTPVSFTNGATTSYIVQGYGYYAIAQVKVTCTAAATFSLSYSGGQSAFSTIIGAPNGPVVPVNGGLVANVQGVVAQQQSAGAVNPVVTGGLELPINQSFTSVGIDTFGSAAVTVPAASNATFTLGTAPTPSQTGELGIGFLGIVSGSGGSILSPWASVSGAAGICSGGSPQFCMVQTANIQPGSVLKQFYGNDGGGGNILSQFALVNGSSPTVRQAQIASGVSSAGFPSNTLAGSTLFASIVCSGTTPCTVSGTTDTQGLTWKQIGSTTLNNGQISAGVVTWAATSPSTAAADTITMTVATGTAGGIIVAEISGTSPAGLNSPAISVAVNPNGQQVVTLDAQPPNQFNCAVTLTTNTTTQCQPSPSNINNVPVRLYVTDVQVNTTVAGTAETIQLKTGTGTNCGTGTANLSAITYNDTALGLSSFLGMRTPLITPTQTAVCVTQAGTAASTVTVEIHGFIAP